MVVHTHLCHAHVLHTCGKISLPLLLLRFKLDLENGGLRIDECAYHDYELSVTRETPDGSHDADFPFRMANFELHTDNENNYIM